MNIVGWVEPRFIEARPNESRGTRERSRHEIRHSAPIALGAAREPDLPPGWGGSTRRAPPLRNRWITGGLRWRPPDRGAHPTGPPPTPAVPARVLYFLQKNLRNCVTLRHRLMPLGLTARNSAKIASFCVTLRHRLMPLGLTANQPADPPFRTGTDGVTPQDPRPTSPN